MKTALRAAALAVCGILLAVSPALAVVPYDTYTYSADGEIAYTTHAYIPEKIMKNSGTIYGTPLESPRDLFADAHGSLYITDTGNNRILELGADGRPLRIIDRYSWEGAERRFSEPSGLFVTAAGDIYVADTGNGLVVALDAAGRAKRVLARPKTGLLEEEFPYRPVSVAVDRYDRVFVVASNVTMGVIVFDAKGNFQNFLGAQRVSYNLTDFLWKQYMTREQKNRMSQFVPTEYSRLEIDSSGFVYAVSTGYDPSDVDASIRQGARDGRIAPIRKLNPSGFDILQRKGYFAPVGDIKYGKTPDGKPRVSAMLDVALGPAGTYTLLDSVYGRIFTYNQRGDLLFAFGAESTQSGNSLNPCAISYRGSDLLALDSVTGNITEYKRTDYGTLLIEAQEKYNNFDDAGAAAVWKSIIEYNPNLDIAYDSIGQSLLREKEYGKALEYFKTSGNRELYSEAFAGIRNRTVRGWFVPVMLGGAAVISLLIVCLRWIGRQNRKPRAEWAHPFPHRVSYAFYVLLHPFKGFYGLKYEGCGSCGAAALLYGFAFLSELLRSTLSAFAFNAGGAQVEIAGVFFRTAGAALLFVLSNWCLTTLMGGEGTLGDIFINTGYALLPLAMLNIVSIPLTYMLTLQEGIYITMLLSAAAAWTLSLIFIGILVAHQYSLFKNIATCAFSVVGMGAILFIILLCASMFSQIYQFFSVVLFELFKR